MRAYVFVRYNSGDGAGHVGWGFDLPDGRVSIGAVENHSGGLFTPAKKMGFWKADVAEAAGPMRDRKYDDVKAIDVPNPDPIAAKRVVLWIENDSFRAISRNCEDDAYDVLRSYGVDDLQAPFFNWFPKRWFHRLRGEALHLEDVLLKSQAAGTHIPGDLTPLKPTWRRPLHLDFGWFKLGHITRSAPKGA